MKKLLILAAALPMLMACSGKSADTQAEAVQADTDSVATVCPVLKNVDWDF